MKARTKVGFTLIELLTVLAIIAILAALLLPVLSEARTSAHKASWIARHRQVGQAHQLYQADYDDRFVLAAYSGELPGTSRTDRTWVQLLLPYSREFELYKCPADPWAGFDSKSAFDVDLIPGDTFSRYYRASKRSNLGYNFVYLSPIVKTDYGWQVFSRHATEINNPSTTLVMADSVHEVLRGGQPRGGGSFLVLPPCRYRETDNGRIDTFRLDDIPETSIFLGGLGKTQTRREDYEAWGGVFAWFRDRVTLSFADGSVSSRPFSYVHAGCELGQGWNGTIINPDDYPWDFD